MLKCFGLLAWMQRRVPVTTQGHGLGQGQLWEGTRGSVLMYAAHHRLTMLPPLSRAKPRNPTPVSQQSPSTWKSNMLASDRSKA